MPSDQDRAVGRGRLAAAATLIFVALNLRMAIAAVPPVLSQIQRDTGLGSAGSGLLTAVPLSRDAHGASGSH